MPSLAAAYTLLGIEFDATATDVRTAYHRLAQRHHPDRTSGGHEQMATINAAREVVLAQIKRRAHGSVYDDDRDSDEDTDWADDLECDDDDLPPPPNEQYLFTAAPVQHGVHCADEIGFWVAIGLHGDDTYLCGCRLVVTVANAGGPVLPLPPVAIPSTDTVRTAHLFVPYRLLPQRQHPYAVHAVLIDQHGRESARHSIACGTMAPARIDQATPLAWHTSEPSRSPRR